MGFVSNTATTVVLSAALLLRLWRLLRIATYGIRTAHSLNEQTSHLRWTLFFLGALLSWVAGGTKLLYYHSYVQFGTLAIGFLLLLLFGFVPDAAYYLSRGLNNLRHIDNPPDPTE